MTLYVARQYRPAYFSGFETEIARGLDRDKITTAPWFRNFEYDGFERFEIIEYGDELMIIAHYSNGKHWVAGFAVEEGSEMSKSPRYREGNVQL